MLQNCVDRQIFDIYVAVGYPKPVEYPSLFGIVASTEWGLQMNETDVANALALLSSVDSRLKLWGWMGTYSWLGGHGANAYVDFTTASNRNALVAVMTEIAGWGFYGLQDDTEDFANKNTPTVNAALVSYWNQLSTSLHAINVKCSTYTFAGWYNFNTINLPDLTEPDYSIIVPREDTEANWKNDVAQAIAYSNCPIMLELSAGTLIDSMDWFDELSAISGVIEGFALYSWSDGGGISSGEWSTWNTWSPKNIVSSLPTPTPTPVSTALPTPNPSNWPISNPLAGTYFLLTETPFIMNYTAGESFAVQSLNPATTITFTVTSGTLNGIGNVNATNVGGIFQILPDSSGTLLATVTGSPASVYIEGVYANNIPYSFFPGDPVITWTYGTSIIVSNNGVQYYFKDETYTTLGVSANGFDSDYGNTYAAINHSYAGIDNVQYAFQAYLVTSPTFYREITTGPSATITVSGNTTAAVSGTVNIPYTSVLLGYQAIFINVTEQFGANAPTVITQFISPVLMTNAIEASTWEFVLEVQQTQQANVTSTSVLYGNTDYRSGVNNILFSIPNESDIQAWRLSQLDFVGFILATYMVHLGTAFYALLLVLFGGVLYFRYGHFGTVAFFFILFGGSGGLVWLLFPAWIAAVASALIILGITFLVWRIIR